MVLYNSSNLVSALRGAISMARLLSGHFYYKTQVQLTLFTFLTRVEYGKLEDGTIDYVKGANVAGFVKVADAMIDQGLV